MFRFSIHIYTCRFSSVRLGAAHGSTGSSPLGSPCSCGFYIARRKCPLGHLHFWLFSVILLLARSRGLVDDARGPGALAPQVVGISIQTGKKQALPRAELLFSQDVAELNR